MRKMKELSFENLISVLADGSHFDQKGPLKSIVNNCLNRKLTNEIAEMELHRVSAAGGNPYKEFLKRVQTNKNE